MSEVFPVSTDPLLIAGAEDSEKVISNGAGATIYYKSDRSVSSLSYDGTLTVGASTTFRDPYWIVSGSQSRVLVKTTPHAEDAHNVHGVVGFADTGSATSITGEWIFSGDPSDPNGTITLDSPTNRGVAAPYKRAGINFWDDGDWIWMSGFDVGEGVYGPGRADFVPAYHRPSGRDIIYITDEGPAGTPRIGITQNYPLGQLDIANIVPGRIGLRLGAPTTVATTLTGEHILPVTPITVASTTGFPTAGDLVVGGWLCSYTGKTATTFTGVTTSAIAVIANGAAVTNKGWHTRFEDDAGGTVGGQWYDGKLAVGFATREPQNAIELDQGTTIAEGIGFGGDPTQIAIFRKAAGVLAIQGQVEGPAGPLEFGAVSVNETISGRALQRAATAITSLTAGSVVNVAITWAVAFVNTNYAVAAEVIETTDEASLRVHKVLGKTTTTCEIRVINDSASTRSGTLMAIGMA